MPSSRGSSRPGGQTCVSQVSCIGRQVFTTSATWEAPSRAPFPLVCIDALPFPSPSSPAQRLLLWGWRPAVIHPPGVSQVKLVALRE